MSRDGATKLMSRSAKASPSLVNAALVTSGVIDTTGQASLSTPS